MKNDELLLIIKTNSYSGNFERELVAYVFGLDESDGYAEEELEEFHKADNAEFYSMKFSEYFDIFRFGSSDSEYYCVDILSHPTNVEYNCDSVMIGVKEKLSDTLYDVMMTRLHEFCEYYKRSNLKILNVSYYRNVLMLDKD